MRRAQCTWICGRAWGAQIAGISMSQPARMPFILTLKSLDNTEREGDAYLGGGGDESLIREASFAFN